MSNDTPKRIGDYEVFRELGHGGMGKVYLARNVLSDRVEALKVLLPDLAGRSEFVSRFTREIKVLAGLDHPNIAALRGAFSAGDQFVMIMEYVDGVTLSALLEQGAFSAADAIKYTDQVLTALSYAHGKHVIHRDIKPGNMMLTAQGVVKLMDFGLARSSDDIGMTMTGTTLGSLDYASPEQVQSQPTDERSDLYSVGVSLYQMVTGKRMFAATSSYSIMQAQINETPRPPIEIVPTLPRALNDVILMAVAKDPAQRFQSATALRNALSQISLTAGASASEAAAAGVYAAAAAPVIAASTAPLMDPGFTVPTPIEPSSPGSRNLMLIAAVVIIAAILAGAMVYRSRQAKEASPVAVVPTQPVTSQASSNGSAASSAGQNLNPASTSPPPLPAQQEVGPSLPQHAATSAHSSKPQIWTSPAASGPSPEEIAAQQQAALEHKKLLDSMETEIDQLDARAATVESSLDTLEQQMHSSGLGLRGDMVAARSSMRTDMTKAKQAMDAGDTERARHFLDMAHHELEKLEAFLGRR